MMTTEAGLSLVLSYVPPWSWIDLELVSRTLRAAVREKVAKYAYRDDVERRDIRRTRSMGADLAFVDERMRNPRVRAKPVYAEWVARQRQLARAAFGRGEIHCALRLMAVLRRAGERHFPLSQEDLDVAALSLPIACLPRFCDDLAPAVAETDAMPPIRMRPWVPFIAFVKERGATSPYLNTPDFDRLFQNIFDRIPAAAHDERTALARAHWNSIRGHAFWEVVTKCARAKYFLDDAGFSIAITADDLGNRLWKYERRLDPRLLDQYIDVCGSLTTAGDCEFGEHGLLELLWLAIYGMHGVLAVWLIERWNVTAEDVDLAFRHACPFTRDPGAFDAGPWSTPLLQCVPVGRRRALFEHYLNATPERRKSWAPIPTWGPRPPPDLSPYPEIVAAMGDDPMAYLNLIKRLEREREELEEQERLLQHGFFAVMEEEWQGSDLEGVYALFNWGGSTSLPSSLPESSVGGGEPE